MPVDNAGNTPATARDLGTLTAATQTFTDWVGSADTDDYYKFTLSGTSNLRLSLTGLSADADLVLYAANGTTFVSRSPNLGSISETININGLAAGTYYARILPFSEATNYSLAVTASIIPDNAGNTIDTARNIGTLTGTIQTFRDWVGNADTNDYYQFTLDGTRNLRVNLTGMSADANVVVYASNGTTVVGSGLHTANSSESININNLAAGTYYVRVYPVGNVQTNYTLSLVTDGAGDTAATARNIGTLTTNNQTFSDSVSNTDLNDYYRFTLNGISSHLSLSLNGMSADANVVVYSSNGTTVVGSGTNTGISSESVNINNLVAGTYYARVFPPGGSSTNYNLSLVAWAMGSDDVSANTTTIGRVTIGSSVTGNINNSVDQDWFRVSLAAGQQVVVDLKGSATARGTLVDPYIRGIYSSNGTLLSNTGDNDSGSGTNSRVTFTAPSVGNYYIAASAGSYGIGSYRLDVTDANILRRDTIYDDPRFSIVAHNLGTTEPPVPVYLNGTLLDNQYQALDVYDRTPNGLYYPGTFTDIVASMYIRNTWQKPDGNASSAAGQYGTSFAGTFSYRSNSGSLNYIPTVDSANITIGGFDRYTDVVTAHFGSVATVTSTRTFPDPTYAYTTVGVSNVMTVQQNVTLATGATRTTGDVLRTGTLSSMYSSSTQYDASLILWQDANGSVHSQQLSATARDAHIFNSAQSLGDWVELVKCAGSTWYSDSPTIRLVIRDTHGLRLGLQGFLAATTNPNDDSLSVWTEVLNPPNSLTAGQRYAVDFDVVAVAPLTDNTTYVSPFSIQLTGTPFVNATLSGTANINAVGNASNNVISGNTGANILTGGAGTDTFRFVTSINSGIDTITDFQSGTDKIQVVSRNFANIPVGTLATNRFVAAGTSLTNSNAVFIYNSTTGGLTFDRDGNGTAAAVQVATLTGHPTLRATDFQVVAA